MISPDMLRFAAESARFYPPDAGTRPIGEQRRLYDAYAVAFALPRPPGIAVEDGALAFGDRAVPVRLYRPRNARGTVVFAHGGGFTLGSRDSHDGIAARIAADAGAAVLALDYRRAPEHRCPAALDDVLAAVAAVRTCATPWPDLAPVPLALAGDSAGGTLAAAAALRLAQEGTPPDALALAYPMLGFEPALPARHAEARAPMLTLAEVRTCRDVYLGDTPPPPGTFPLDARALDGMPPTCLIAAEHDPLRDDAVAFAGRLRAVGIGAECIIGTGLVHGFLRAIDRSAESARVFAMLVRFLQRELRRS